MKTKLMSGEEFADKYNHENIKIALQMFASNYTKKLPSFLINDVGNGQIMLDVLRVSETSIFLPVVIRSTNWLQHINRVGGTMLKMCLHEEMWPVQNRFQLVGGLSEISENDIEGALYRYLENSVDYWKSRQEDCAISVSVRVKEFAQSNDFNKLLEQVQIIELSDAYKVQEVLIF